MKLIKKIDCEYKVANYFKKYNIARCSHFWTHYDRNVQFVLFKNTIFVTWHDKNSWLDAKTLLWAYDKDHKRIHRMKTDEKRYNLNGIKIVNILETSK